MPQHLNVWHMIAGLLLLQVWTVCRNLYVPNLCVVLACAGEVLVTLVPMQKSCDVGLTPLASFPKLRKSTCVKGCCTTQRGSPNLLQEQELFNRI